MNRETARSATRWAASVFATVLCALQLTGCDASRTAEVIPPQPGQLVLRFQTSNDAEGAVRLRLQGPDVGTISAVQPGTLALVRANGSHYEVVVVGTMKTGELLRIQVSDVNRLDEYAASIVEVAGTDNALRSNPEGYGIEIAR